MTVARPFLSHIIHALLFKFATVLRVLATKVCRNSPRYSNSTEKMNIHKKQLNLPQLFVPKNNPQFFFLL